MCSIREELGAAKAPANSRTNFLCYSYIYMSLHAPLTICFIKKQAYSSYTLCTVSV